MKKILLLILTATMLLAWGDTDYAKKALQNRLKDTQSAQFKSLFRNYKTGVICGFVNAKNGFGGYTGYKRFVGGNGVAFFQSDMKSRAEFVNVWNKLCK